MDFAGSPFEIKSLDDSGAISGLLAGFGDVDRGGDRLLPGCLTKSLAERTTPLPMLLHHDLKRPIGAWKEWTERADGLFVTGSLTLVTRDAQEAHALAKDGALTGLSIGWRPIKTSNGGGGVRVVSDAEIVEGSLVTVPMHDRTRVATVKSISGPRDLADMFQEAGVSGRRARIAAGVAWKAIHEQPDEGAADAELAAILTGSIDRLKALGGH